MERGLCYHKSMLRLENIKVFENMSDEEILKKALKKYRIRPSDVVNSCIAKKSIDARDKKNVHYLYAFDVEVTDEEKYPSIRKSLPQPELFINKRRISRYRPVIVGAGPAGLFCALTLIEYGYKPIIIERGSNVEARRKYVEEYRQTGILNPACNVQFGEGGAGTFSDGKLTTGINSPHISKVLKTFHEFGAPEEVTYLAHPHIGTDNLQKILVNIRKHIEDQGGTYLFDTRLANISREGDLLKLDLGETVMETDCVVLAIGHSARDTFEMLYRNRIAMKRKDFSVGVRIEHLQEDINRAQYGEYTRLKLPAAEYKLSYHDQETGRACYSFCMCPGGEVIASSSDPDGIVTNGMSNFARDGRNANAALLVNVTADDLAGDSPLEGIYFQKELERRAWQLGGQNGHAPVQRYEDFKENRPSTELGKVIPSYKPGYRLSNLNEILPDYVSATLKKGISYFGGKIRGFDDPDAVLTGLETRTSSPVTIIRDERMQASIPGIYPCGEGAGYAGGITSAAVDGIKVAISIIESE